MNYFSAKIKLTLELIIMWPFVRLGKVIGNFYALKTKHKVFFILPNRDIGGAPQVNLDILACLKDKNPVIIFTKKGLNNLFAEQYEQLGIKIIDIHHLIDNKLYHYINFIFRGIVATWIKKQDNAVVFGGECIFFYKIIPHLDAKTLKIDLCHLPTWVEYTKVFAPYIDTRVFSTNYLKKRTETEYQSTSVPSKFQSKLHFVESAIDIPQRSKNKNELLEIFFIGRGAPQKRVHLSAMIAKKCNELKIPAHFNFVGDVEKLIDTKDFPYCTFYGNIKEQDQMLQLYKKADVLLMTSKNEGLPVVVMQMMAMGKIIIATAVDAIPDYIIHEKTGYLISTEAEDEIVNVGTALVKHVLVNPERVNEIGNAARTFAIENFSKKKFCKAWTQIFKF